MELKKRIAQVLQGHRDVVTDPTRATMIQEAVGRREALVSANGALATWTPPESTGRSPKDTYIVRRPECEANIDWDSPNNIPLEPETFDMLMEDALHMLSARSRLYVTNRTLVADTSYAMPVKTVSYWALTALFTDNMFRPVPPDIERSIFADRPFTLVVAPYDKLDRTRYQGRLRRLPDGRTSDMAVAVDFDRQLGVVVGSAYAGSVKKLMFTLMNYMLPGEGILPLHCSANEGPGGDIALLLGLSGTGKTTLSADPRRALLGDDEHGWSDNGIANFENGCYAKLINLRENKEPEIWRAVFHEVPPSEHGAIVENCMMYPWGAFDVDDERYTPNSRASYPLRFLSNIKTPPVGDHPKTILFLAADANGILPPVARLTPEQAMLWLLMGYTCKVAGTETGIVDPVSTFSRFFGKLYASQPRRVCLHAGRADEEVRLAGVPGQHRLERWTLWDRRAHGHRHHPGHRPRSLERRDGQRRIQGRSHLPHPDPQACPDVPCEILNPRNTWEDKDAFDRRARKLANDFSAHFDKAYGNKGIDPKVISQCPGK